MSDTSSSANAFMDMLAKMTKVSTEAGAGMQALGLAQKTDQLKARMGEAAELGKSLRDLSSAHLDTLKRTYGASGQKTAESFRAIWGTPKPPAETMQAFSDYMADAMQRSILFLDIMRRVGNTSVEQAKGGGDPVLVYDYAMVTDGRSFERPVNYALVHILPPAGVEVDPTLRPYIIIDPRAGHGAGIGGFKSDSQVGVALAHGHSVYFTIFFQQPEAGQTLADVCAAEGRFVRDVALRHPHAPRPVVIGNCQGGWAAMLLAASNPHVTGPVVINGAPMSYWAGVRGKNPMRYLGGLVGGAMPALLLSDLGNGRFDGANLVMNFEAGNPGNTWWGKYYNVFANVDTEAERFIGFERWWSSFYFMNEQEIRWIVENLFIGNRLQHGNAVLGRRGAVDLRKIKAPIIVFASRGDDITPPQQALNWIPKVYGNEREIRARGQRIVYMVHDSIGHLGIFVSAKVAVKEHDKIVNTLGMIEALAPGLYEMRIEQQIGQGIDARFVVSFQERTIADLKALDDGDIDETPFALVDRVSHIGVDLYEMTMRPMVQAMVTPASADAMVQMNPMRLRRRVLSDENPAMPAVARMAEQVRAARKPVAPGNPFFQTEKLFAAMVEQSLTFFSDLRSAQQELAFFALYGNPFLRALAQGRGRDDVAGDANAGVAESLSEMPDVEAALARIGQGGFAEAVIRMLVLMARSRGAVRESRLHRSNEILHSTPPFDTMDEARRTHIIHEQTLVVDFEQEAAILALPALLPGAEERSRALALVADIAGDPSEMSEPTVRMLARLRAILAAPKEEKPKDEKPKPAARAKPLDVPGE
jgi:pimeloyl-ACP methyl ester carboxylesterase/tellurite resistance protein